MAYETDPGTACRPSPGPDVRWPGIPTALPNPQLWSGSLLGVQVSTFGMEYAIVAHPARAAAMVFGVAHRLAQNTVVPRRSRPRSSLASELIGTTDRWPFGNYVPAPKVFARRCRGIVPYTIPPFGPTWGRRRTSWPPPSSTASRRRPFGGSGAGSWLPLAWDVVADPGDGARVAADQVLGLSESGIFDAVQELVAWYATAGVYRRRRPFRRLTRPGRGALTWAPLVTYIANCVRAAALERQYRLAAISPAALVALAPAAASWRCSAGDRRGARASARSGATGVYSMTGTARPAVSQQLRWYSRRCRTRGRGRRARPERVPRQGPAVLAARHYHHLHDATVLMTVLQRCTSWWRSIGCAAVGPSHHGRFRRMARWPTALQAATRRTSLARHRPARITRMNGTA